MRVFVVGAPCAGKTTVARHLRASRDLHVIDMDDEILRLNGGTWPDFVTKNERLQPKVLEAARSMQNVVLLNSYMSVERTAQLRQAHFHTVLLDVSESELRRRDDVRLAAEGWTNIEWFDRHQSNLRELRDHGLIDQVISGEQDPAVVAAEILKCVDDLSRLRTD